MATIDNINTYLTNLQTYKTNIATAIEDKGVTVPDGTMYDGFAALIDQIDGGSGTSYPNGKEWTSTNINGERIFHVCYTSSGWYAFSNDEIIYKSADGKSWIEDTSISYESDIFTALKGRTAVWTKHDYSDEVVLSSTTEVVGYSPIKKSSSTAWADAITSAVVSNIPYFFDTLTLSYDINNNPIPFPDYNGGKIEITSTMAGSNFQSAWGSVLAYNPGYIYAYNPVTRVIYTTNSNVSILYEVTGVREDFDAYPECGVHTDDYYYIRRCIEYSNGNIIVRAPRDNVMGKYGLQYSTNGGSTWIDSNVVGTSSSYQFDCVYYAGGMWVAGGNKGLYYSTDGKTWTLSNMSERVWSLYYANFMWVIGTREGIYYSLTWELPE